MEEIQTDINQALRLDGNAAAGILYDVFAAEMTASPTECTYCGQTGEIGDLFAYIQGPGIVLRCTNCHNVILRIVRTPEAIYLDARGAVYLRVKQVRG
jgi:hypothetical protein